MASDFNNWKYRATFHVDHTKVSADYGAFSLIMRWTGAVGALPSAMLQTGNAQAAKSDGGDLRFTDQYGNEVPFDIVDWTQAAAIADAHAELWVQLPSLSTTVDTTFYMFWGNAAASGYSSSDPFGRYNAFTGWNMVYHGNDTGSGNMNNSAAATWGMTNSGTTIIDGKIGKARSFDGSSNYMYISGGLSAGNPNFGTYWTAMGWVYWNGFSPSVTKKIFDFGNGAGTDNFEIHSEPGSSPVTGTIHLFNNTSDHTRQDASLWATGAWKHFIYTWDGGAGTLNLYINGAVVGSATSAPGWLRDAARSGCFLGKSNWGGGDLFNGYLDEMRFGNSVATATYASVAYNAQNAPESFVIFDATISKPTFPTGWRYKCPLTQDHTKVGTGTQSNFTSLFVWTGSQATSNLPQVMFDADGGQAAKSDGSDIRFTSDAAGTTQVPFEVDSFSTNNDPSLARAEIWVQVPSVNSSTDTVIYVWWGKSDAVAYLPGEAYGKYAAWLSSYKAVYHCDGSGNLADSTSNVSTAINSGTTEVAGKIGKARSCDGSSQYASLASNLGITSGDVTEEVWFKATNTTDSHDHPALISHYDDGVKVDYRIFQWTTGIGVARHAPSVVWGSTAETAIGAGTWYRADLVYSGTTLSFYLNGAFQRSITINTAGTGSYTTQLVLGKGTATAPYYFNGSLDEIKISNIARSAAWILTDYNSQSSPQTFWGVGTVVVISQVGIVISSVWKTVSAVFVVISGVWKSVSIQKIVISNAWKDC